jgi:hypothetical protein
MYVLHNSLVEIVLQAMLGIKLPTCVWTLQLSLQLVEISMN